MGTRLHEVLAPAFPDGELRDDDELRRRRDEAAEELYSTLVGIRQAVLAGFGPEQIEPLLGYEGSTPADPLVLHRVAGRALELLRTPPAELPPLPQPPAPTEGPSGGDV